MKRLTKELYKAIKSRITVVIPDSADYKLVVDDFKERGWEFNPNIPLYRLNVKDLDADYFDIIQPINSRNLWNIAQRLYSHTSTCFEGFDLKLVA